MQKFSFVRKFSSGFWKCLVQFVQAHEIAEKEDALKSSIRKYLMIYSIEIDLRSLESKLSFYLFIHAPEDLPRPVLSYSCP